MWIPSIAGHSVWRLPRSHSGLLTVSRPRYLKLEEAIELLGSPDGYASSNNESVWKSSLELEIVGFEPVSQVNQLGFVAGLDFLGDAKCVYHEYRRFKDGLLSLTKHGAFLG